jgi:hypothetical protein
LSGEIGVNCKMKKGRKLSPRQGLGRGEGTRKKDVGVK